MKSFEPLHSSARRLPLVLNVNGWKPTPADAGLASYQTFPGVSLPIEDRHRARCGDG